MIYLMFWFLHHHQVFTPLLMAYFDLPVFWKTDNQKSWANSANLNSGTSFPWFSSPLVVGPVQENREWGRLGVSETCVREVCELREVSFPLTFSSVSLLPFSLQMNNFQSLCSHYRSNFDFFVLWKIPVLPHLSFLDFLSPFQDVVGEVCPPFVLPPPVLWIYCSQSCQSAFQGTLSHIWTLMSILKWTEVQKSSKIDL